MKRVIIQQCMGLIGALRLSVDALTSGFPKSRPSETDLLLYYLSSNVLDRMARVFDSNYSYPVDTVFKNFLATCFISGFTIPPIELNSKDEICLNRYKKRAYWLIRVGC